MTEPSDARQRAIDTGRLLADLVDRLVDLEDRIATLEDQGHVSLTPSKSIRIWFNTAQAADHAGCHVDTVLKACEADELHGYQRKAGGRWRIHVDDLTAWMSK